MHKRHFSLSAHVLKVYTNLRLSATAVPTSVEYGKVNKTGLASPLQKQQ